MLAAHLGSLVIGEVAVGDEPCTNIRVAPRSPGDILGVRVVVTVDCYKQRNKDEEGSCLPNEFLELLTLDLRVALYDVVFDKPSLKLRVGPAVPHMARRVVVIVLHALDKGRAGRRDIVVGVDTVFVQPFILVSGQLGQSKTTERKRRVRTYEVRVRPRVPYGVGNLCVRILHHLQHLIPRRLLFRL